MSSSSPHVIKLEPVSPRVSGCYSSVADSDGGLDQETAEDDVFDSSDIKDDRLKTAVTNAWMQQQITPLVKEELRATILTRRHAKGQGEVEFKKPKPAPKRELTEEEKNRKLRRKEQNRRAATKCRHKKKSVQEELKVAYDQEREKSIALQKEIFDLNREKDELERLLKNHLPSCVQNTVQQFNEYTTPIPLCHQQVNNYPNSLCVPHQIMCATSPSYTTTDNELHRCATSPNICVTSPSLYGTHFDFEPEKMAEKCHTITSETGLRTDENVMCDFSLEQIPDNSTSSCLDYEENSYSMTEINALLDCNDSLSLTSDDLNSVVANALSY